MQENVELYDVTIIGGGTTGLFTAYYSGMRDMKTKVIESKQKLGGKVAQFLPEKLIYDIGGIPEISGDDLVKQMERQANKHHPTIITNEWIEDITKLEDGSFILTSREGNKHYSKAVIMTTGMGSFNVNGSQLKTISYDGIVNWHDTMSNVAQFANKNVLIVSNHRIGLDWAITLESLASKVYLINNKKTFHHASIEELTRLDSSDVNLRRESSIKHIKNEEDGPNQVYIEGEDDIEEKVEVDHLLIYDGVKLDAAPFKQWGLATEKNRVVVDATTMATNTDGIFAAGDATIYPRKTMLIATGYSEAIVAVNSVKNYIDPDANVHVYSTVIYRKK